MAVLFKDHRLCVGFRAKDWIPVWYKPIGLPDEDGGAQIGLFRESFGAAQYREPTEGEVHWQPTFDIALCESKNIDGRRKIQRQTLYDAWRYMNETDPEKLQELEEELHDPAARRLQSWFELAQKEKRSKMQAAETRKRRREKKSNANAVAGEEESDGDSAFGDDAPRPDRRGLTGGLPIQNTQASRPKLGSSLKPASRKANQKQKHRVPVADDMDECDDRDVFSSELPVKKRKYRAPFVEDVDDGNDDDDDDFSFDRPSKRFASHGLSQPRFSPETRVPRTPFNHNLGSEGLPQREASYLAVPGRPSWPFQPQSSRIGLQTPRSQTTLATSQGIDGSERTFGLVNSRGNDDVIDAERAPSNNGNIIQRFNGVDSQDQAIATAIQMSKESMIRETVARESAVPRPSIEMDTVKPESNDQDPNDQD